MERRKKGGHSEDVRQEGLAGAQASAFKEQEEERKIPEREASEGNGDKTDWAEKEAPAENAGRAERKKWEKDTGVPNLEEPEDPKDPGEEEELPDLEDLEEEEELPDLEDLGEEEELSDLEDLEEEEDPDDYEEEPLKPWKTVLVFLGLIVLASVICAVLWHFSHSEGPEGSRTEGERNSAAGTESDVLSGEGADSASRESDSGEVPSQDGSMGIASGTEESAGEEDSFATEPVSGTREMEFTAVQQSVTPKDVINLRSVPTTLDTDNIVVQIQNGTVLTRIGINEDTGWSKVEYEGETLYAVSQYLTMDLNYKPSIEASNPNRVSTKDGRIIIFADCDDWISPKEYVNLRIEPSTSEGNETVSCQLNYGEKVHRTGFSPDSGWSRVEYNGQVLYVVTSLMLTVEE